MSQRLVIEGVKYDMEDGVSKASIRTLVDLQKTAGISVNSIVDALAAMGKMSDPREVFDSVETMTAFAGLVFLCRRKAGEDISFDDAMDVALADVGFEFDDEDDDEDADDPKDPSTPGDDDGDGEQ